MSDQLAALKKKPAEVVVEDAGAKKEVAALTKTLAEKEKQLALKVEENFGMRDVIDRQKLENEKMRKEMARTLEKLENKDL